LLGPTGLYQFSQQSQFIAPTADLSALDGCSDIPLNLLKPQKYGANAPYLRPILKKYGANAPQLRYI